MKSGYFSPSELAIVRRAYARQMLAVAGFPDDRRLEDAFATVPRERFLGDPPWSFSRGFGYRTLPSDDPALLCQDILFALSADRGVNNGSPSLHAAWMGALALREGARVAHLGAGTGYYSAILAEVAGETGAVDAVEIDPALAEQARSALSIYPHVRVSAGDAMQPRGREFDAIYINFAVERPVKAWTDSLAPGGRLVFPLGVAQDTRGKPGVRHSSQGAALMVERREAGLAVRWLGKAWFVCADGISVVTDAERERLKAAFQRGSVEFVNSLHWDNAGPAERNWLHGDGWRLSYDAVDP